MRQIDLMVTAKKAEWENHIHAVKIQLDKKTKELDFVKVQLEQKSQEVCNNTDSDFRFLLLCTIYKIITLTIFTKITSNRKKEKYITLHNQNKCAQ